MIKLRLFKELGDFCGGKEWNLNVTSAKGAIEALNILTDNKFARYFIQNNKLYSKYRVLINERDFYAPVNEINENNYDMINQSELVMKKKDIKTVDIVPFIENSDSRILAGIVIAIGIVLLFVPGGAPIGIGLIAAGAVIFLTKPPAFANFRNIDKAGNESYLFGGPINIIGEGGPVPVGYGRVLVGSQVISSAFKIVDYQTFRDR